MMMTHVSDVLLCADDSVLREFTEFHVMII